MPKQNKAMEINTMDTNNKKTDSDAAWEPKEETAKLTVCTGDRDCNQYSNIVIQPGVLYQITGSMARLDGKPPHITVGNKVVWMGVTSDQPQGFDITVSI